jgi:hypothetical protein
MSALNAIPDSTYYVWTGLSKPKSAVGDWQRSLKRVFELGGVPDARRGAGYRLGLPEKKEEDNSNHEDSFSKT